jgi:hypothetical protein
MARIKKPPCLAMTPGFEGLAGPAVGRPIASLMIRVQYPIHIDFYEYKNIV